MALRQQISKKYMETFTAHLSSAGILGIKRGKDGGYRLLTPPSEVTLLDILQNVEDSMNAVACLECQPNRCARAPFCISLPAWEGLDSVVQQYLSSVTLQQLIDQAKPQPENSSDYSCGV